ncbi:hypothetical protein D3C71_182470 [compost metagenome]
MFGVLNPDIFAVFSGGNRRLYEVVLTQIYETWFRNELLFPQQGQILAQIYAVLSERPELWREGEEAVTLDSLVMRPGKRMRRRNRDAADATATTDAMARARYIYARLLDTGWLEESRFGLKVTVDMPAGALRLIELLCQLQEGVSEELGGLVSQIKATLEALEQAPRDNAMALHKAARDAGAFGRYLRSVLSALREIDQQILASESLESRLRHYFEDFVERVLLKDYAAISTTSHPYRFRHHILAKTEAVETSEVALAIIAEVYAAAQLRPDADGARRLVHDELAQIRRVFDQIQDAFERIKQHRGRLEARLRHTVRYAGRRGSAYLQRSERLLQALDRHVEADDLEIHGDLEPLRHALSPHVLARARAPRSVIEGQAMVVSEPDPVWVFRQTLEQDFMRRLNVRPEQILRFLERHVAPGDARPASTFWIDGLDDFLAFEALRVLVPSLTADQPDGPVAETVSRHFSVRRLPGRVESEWIACDDFEVRRLTENITLESADA